MLLADADFFIGLYLARDSHHSDCVAMSKKITENVISSHGVIDEVMTKISYFKRLDLAVQFYEQYINQGIQIVYLDKILVDKAVTVMKSQTKTHVSLTDCINIAIAQEKGITHILSFDKIYEKNGLKLFK